jgi:hypothetical protein
MSPVAGDADLPPMQPDDSLTLQGFSLQREHLQHRVEGQSDEIDIQALLRWYYAELDTARVTDPKKPTEG